MIDPNPTNSMKQGRLKTLLAAALFATALSVSAQSSVLAIFAKARAAVDEDDKLSLCGFYTGMSAADARTLAGYYGLKDDEWRIEGDPVYMIGLTLKGVRRVTKGGNTFDELAQAVANHVGSLKQNWETGDYSRHTIDGIFIGISESSGFVMVDIELSPAGQEAREKREAAERKAAERKAREEREAAERKAREEREAAERKLSEYREASKRKATEEARRSALAWKGKTKTVPISGSVAIKLRSVPGNLWFGQYEVTQAEWEAVMGENPSRFKNPDNPVERVSWDDCQEFLKKLNALPSVKESGLTFRLPPEEEWKAACRAGSTGSYCLLADGTEIAKDTLGRVAWFDGNADNRTHPVGQKEPNAFGLYDMHGNVWEWTSTEEGADRVRRGGCWYLSALRCRSSDRNGDAPSSRFDDLGFRLCADGGAD